MKATLAFILLFSMNILHAQEVISYTNNNVIISTNGLNLPKPSGSIDMVKKVLGGHKVIRISEEIVYVIHNSTSDYRIRPTGIDVRIVNIKTNELIKDINLPYLNSYYNQIYHFNSHDQKLYIVGPETGPHVTIINTQNHTIEDEYTINFSNNRLYEYFQLKKLAVITDSNTLYLKSELKDDLLAVNLLNNKVTHIPLLNFDRSVYGRVIKFDISHDEKQAYLYRSEGHIEVFDLEKNDSKIMGFSYPIGKGNFPVLSTDTPKIYIFNKNKLNVYDTTTEKLLNTISYELPEHFKNHTINITDTQLHENVNKLFITFEILTDEGDQDSKHSALMVFDLKNKSSQLIELEMRYGSPLNSNIIIGISQDYRYAFLSTLSSNRRIYVVDLQTMSLIKSINVGFKTPTLINNHIVLSFGYTVDTYPIQSLVQESDINLSANRRGGISKKYMAESGRVASHPQLPLLYVTIPYSNIHYSEIPVIPGYQPQQSLSVLNAYDKSIIANLDVGQYPLGVTVDPEGKLGYVANCSDNSVTIFDAEKFKIVDTVSIGDQPVSMAINKSNDELYITQQGDNSIAVVDVLSRKIIANIALSEAPGNIVLNPQDNKAYVTTLHGNNLLVVDLLNRTQIKAINISNHATEKDKEKTCLTEFIERDKKIIPSLFNRGITMTSDGTKIITAISEIAKVIVINTASDTVQQKINYAELNNSTINHTNTEQQLFLDSLYLGKDTDTHETEWAINLFDDYNIIITDYEWLPLYNIEQESISFNEIHSNNHLYDKSWLKTGKKSNKGLNIFELFLGDRILDLPITDNDVTIHSSETGTINIPNLLVQVEDEVENCQLVLKELVNNPSLFTIQEENSCKSLQAVKDIVENSLCGAFTGQPCSEGASLTNSDSTSSGFTDSTHKFCNIGKVKSVEFNPFHEMVFQLNYYLTLNPDVASYFGDDHEGVKKHWKNTGIKEGRVASPLFDVKYYLNSYEDLKNVYGTDYENAMRHWFNYGLNEGRKSSPVFDVQYYVSSNPDLFNVFGTNFERAIRHWLKNGSTECRVTSQDFQVMTYLSHNPDVYKAFNGNCPMAMMHWMKQGRNESRTSSTSLNYATNDIGCR